MNKFKFMILWFVFLLLYWFVVAQSGLNLDLTVPWLSKSLNDWLGQTTCIEWKYEISWPQQVKVGIPVDVRIMIKWNIQVPWIKSVDYILSKDNSNLELYRWLDYSHTFINPWDYKLTATIKELEWCEYNIETTIKVYKSILFYIWVHNEDIDIPYYEDKFEKNSLLMKEIFLDDNKYLSESTLVGLLKNNIVYFNNADVILINSSDFAQIIEIVWKYAWLYQISLLNKKFIIVQTINKNFFRSILPKYIKLIWTKKIYFTEQDNVEIILKEFSSWKDISDISEILFLTLSFWDLPNYYFLSYIIDYLIYDEFPIHLIWLMLSLIVSVLLVSIFRQIIWFSVFGVYNPIYFAISLYLIGIELSIIVLLVAFFASYIVRIFNKWFYMLYSAQISILVIVYFVLCIISFWLLKISWIELIDFSVFSNSLIIFPIILWIVVSNKIFHENFNLFSSLWWFSFFEFMIVSMTIYFLISWSNFQYLLLTYPSIVFLILVLNIIVGRFTWLQLLEYFRFLPLIKKQFDEEE